MIHFRLLYLLFFLLPGIVPVNVQGQQDTSLTELEAYIENARQTFDIPGIAVGIIKDGEIVMNQGFGYRNTETKVKTDENTIFGIASCSKAFTAACIGILVDEGKLNWDDKVIDHMPEFRMYDPAVTAEMEVQDLLSHRSGLITFDGDLLWYGSNYSRKEVMHQIRYREPTYSFRSKFGYQNVMFIAAGELIKKVSGLTWDDFLEQKILEPLSMNSSNTTNSTFSEGMNIAYPHVDGKPLDFIDYDNSGPAASMNSSTSDLLKWIQMLLDKGKSESTQIMSEEIYYDLTAPHTLLPSGHGENINGTHFRAYGLGWFLNDLNGRKIIQHGGGLPGFHSKVVLVPEENLGFVIIANQLSGLVPAVYMKILDEYVTHEETDWAAKYYQAIANQNKRKEIADSTWKANRQMKTKPSLSNKAYVGIYEDAMYGKATVELEGKNLWLRLLPTEKLFTAKLEHWHYNTYKVAFNDPYLPPGYVTFHINEKGDIQNFTIKLDNPDFHFYKLDFVKVVE